MRKISLGCSDFKRTIEDNYYFVDKTLYIKEIVEASKKTYYYRLVQGKYK